MMVPSFHLRRRIRPLASADAVRFVSHLMDRIHNFKASGPGAFVNSGPFGAMRGIVFSNHFR
jgi:hypothetical protein